MTALGAGAATTLTVAEVQEDSVRSYQVGDSVLLLVGQRGRIKYQSISHSPVGFALESGLLDEGEALRHADRHLVSNLLGARDMRIELGPLRRGSRRATRCCSRATASPTTCAGARSRSARRGPLAEAARRLVVDARAPHGAPAPGDPSKPDDLTFILFSGIASGRLAAARSEAKPSEV